MSIWTRNILEFKLVRILVVIGIIIFAIFYLIDYNSLENKCKRKVNQLSSYLPIQPLNELQKMQFDIAKKPLIEECIKNKKVQ